MVNMSKSFRRKKLQKYIELGDLKKLKAFIKQNDIDVKDFAFKKGNSILHIACQHGSDIVVRYLLKKTDVDVLLANKAGQLPIHLACNYALEGHRSAETDLILPLIHASSSSLDVEDNSGVTARHLLQDIKDRLRASKNKHRQKSEKSEAASSDRSWFSEPQSWSEKLADELQDEYNSSWGAFEQDFSRSDERDSETWDEWAARLSSEHSTRTRQQAYSYGPLPSKRKHSTEKTESGDRNEIPKISDEKRKEFERKMADAQKAYGEQISARRKQDRVEQKAKYEKACTALYKSSSSSPIHYSDVPWPHPPGDFSPLYDAVVKFLFSDLETGSAAYRSYLRLQRVNWHPDRFLHRCSGRIIAVDREKILAKVNEISQILNQLSEKLDGQ